MMNYSIDKPNMCIRDAHLFNRLEIAKIPYTLDVISFEEIGHDPVENASSLERFKSPVISQDMNLVGNFGTFNHLKKKSGKATLCIVIQMDHAEAALILYEINKAFEDQYGDVLAHMEKIKADNERNSKQTINKVILQKYDDLEAISELPFNPENFFKHYDGYRFSEYREGDPLKSFFSLEPDNQKIKYKVKVQNPLFINDERKLSIKDLSLSFLKRRYPSTVYNELKDADIKDIVRKVIIIARDVLNYDSIIFNEKQLCLLK